MRNEREKKKRLVLLACGVTGILSLTLSPTWFFSPAKADNCPIDATGKVVPGATFDGRLQHQGGMFFVQRAGGEMLFPPITPPSSRGPHNESWHRSERLVTALVKHAGEVVHIEVCGRTVLQVNANGSDAYTADLRTQADLNAEFASSNFFIRLSWSLCFAVFLCSAAVWLTLYRKPADVNDRFTERSPRH
jgi:hypothetical protein